MCFSPTVSFVASGAIGSVGVLTLRQVKSKSEIPLASMPLLFAVQQFIEGVIWLSFDWKLMLVILTYAYSFFSHILWPIFFPLSIYLIEHNLQRKKILKFFIFIGILIALYDLFYMILYSVGVQVTDNSIDYFFTHIYPKMTLMIYALAVVVSALISSHRVIRIFGLSVGSSLIMAMLFYHTTFISIWCFFAAVLSIFIYWHFKTTNKHDKKIDHF